MADSFKPDSFKADLPGDSFKPDSFTADSSKTAHIPTKYRSLLRKIPLVGSTLGALDENFAEPAIERAGQGFDRMRGRGLDKTESRGSQLVGGASDIGEGILQGIAPPFLLQSGLTAPIRTAAALGTGLMLKTGSQIGAEALGSEPGYAQAGSDILGALGGGLVHGLSGPGTRAALTKGVGTAIRKIPGISLPLDMLDAYRSASATEPQGTPDFGPWRPPNPASMPPRAPIVEAAYGPGRAPSPVPLPPRAPMPDVLYGPGRAPNPAPMPPRAPIQPIEAPQFGPGKVPNPVPVPPAAPPRPMGFDPRAAPNPAVMPPRAPVQLQPEPLFGPGKAPNPARMPPRAPTAEPGVPTPKTQPTPEIKPVQPTEDDWQDTNRALHAMAQEKELPGSPAGSRKGAHDYVKSLAKSLYNVNSTADLDVSQMKNIQEMIRTGKIPKK